MTGTDRRTATAAAAAARDGSGRRGLLWLVAVLSLIAVWTVSTAAAQAQGIRLIRDTEIEGLLRDYGDPLFKVGGLNPDDVEIYIVNDGSVNAFVTGGQNIFFTTGMLTSADQPNELIGVMAHEAGHITGGHLARRGEVASSATTPMIVGMALGILAAAAGSPDAAIALLMGGQHVAQRNVLSYSRVQEASADQAAMTMLEATGQSPRGMIKFFDRFRDQEILSGVNQDPYVRTHPLSRDRVRVLTDQGRRSPFWDATDSEAEVHRLRMAQAKLYGFLAAPASVLNRYPASDTSQPARYARAVAYFRMPRIDAAVAEIDSLIAEEPENPYFHELKGQILFEGGRVAQSIAPYREAVSMRPDAVLMQVSLARALLASDPANADPAVTEEAKEHLRRAVALEAENPFVWQHMAAAHARAGETSLAALATAERYYAVGNRQEAAIFAARAQRDLETGTPDWNRAQDIIGIGRDRDWFERERRGPSLRFDMGTAQPGGAFGPLDRRGHASGFASPGSWQRHDHAHGYTLERRGTEAEDGAERQNRWGGELHYERSLLSGHRDYR